ncbi:MAG: SpoIIE family protein phosphatase [Parachlamydiales bacterium]|jgi:sigma-B regulation protein RsbU (phosphoserine phosphatase)
MSSLLPTEVITTPLLKPLSTFVISVLLIDDQEIIGETIRSMLSDQTDISFHYCKDPSYAIDKAMEVNPTVILQDLVMPDIDGLELTRYFRAHEKTRDIPLIVLSSKEDPAIKAEAFAVGANDYMVKLPDKLELIARIRYHSNAYIRLLERNEAYEKLRESQHLLNDELAEAAQYVRSQLPNPMKSGPRANWQFTPSQQLGGDAFGYHWIDDDHFVIFLLDVCGHGIGAALLSISVMNVLQSQTLSLTDYKDPKAVMHSLNAIFPMEKHNNMFFTIWYGVWCKSKGQLSYSSAGHPPAVLFQPGKSSQKLRTEGIVIGAISDAEFSCSTCEVPLGSQLYVFSDGVYEVTNPSQGMMHLDDLLKILDKVSANPSSALKDIQKAVHSFSRTKEVSDDYSIVQIIFA